MEAEVEGWEEMDVEDPDMWDDDDEEWGQVSMDNSEETGSHQPATVQVHRIIQYETIGPDEVNAKLQESIAEFGEMMGLQPPYDDAKLVLQYYEWNTTRATTEYFMGNQESLRINAGIDSGTSDMLTTENTVECPICLDDVDQSQCAGLTCNHTVCLDCWSGYVKNAAKSRSCFRLKCPMDGCEVAATTTRLCKLGIEAKALNVLERRQKKFRLVNYVESSRDYQMCLGPDCELVQRMHMDKKKLSDIKCRCGHVYCVRCLQDGHRPCPCDIAEAWVQKATSEAENMQWILARTKKCPKCRVPIEKNQGCNHMTCRNCKHEFCWLCKGDWKEHGSATGGFYKCNIYDKQKVEGNLSNEERAQQDAKTELERYSFYFTRYDNHIRAISQMKKTFAQAESRMGELMSQYKWKPNDASFIKDASVTIQDCRRLLAWTYPIGYYMEESFHLRDLFHQYQKDLEVYTEHLHELAEQPLEVFRDNDKRAEVINYQRVTQKYRDNLLRAIEKDINPNTTFVGVNRM